MGVKLGRGVRSEAIDWTHLTINSNVPSAACPNFALRFEDAEVMIPVCYYAKTTFSIHLTAVDNADEVAQF